MKRNEVDRNKLSPVMIQYLDIKDKYEDYIIFFRLGDFYEMFFDDAILVSRLLEITLTGKQAGLEERVPMCGIPYHSYASYLNTLVEQGYKVAIVEQLTDPKDTKGMVERDVVQIITQGTRLDTDLDAKDNNYIASLYQIDNTTIISYIDVSTGEVNVKLVDNNKVIETINKLNIKEVIVNESFDRDTINKLRTNFNILVTITNKLIENNEYEYIYNNLDDSNILKNCNTHKDRKVIKYLPLY